MLELKPVRSGLDVGFDGGSIPPKYAQLKCKAWRSVPAGEEIPFEDSQFDAVIMNGAVVSRPMVREAHRVLKPEGRLYFTVPEKNSASPNGFILPEIYTILRDGYNIIGVQRPHWWNFARAGRTISICAQKKTWRLHTNTYRPYV